MVGTGYVNYALVLTLQADRGVVEPSSITLTTAQLLGLPQGCSDDRVKRDIGAGWQEFLNKMAQEEAVTNDPANSTIILEQAGGFVDAFDVTNSTQEFKDSIDTLEQNDSVVGTFGPNLSANTSSLDISEKQGIFDKNLTSFPVDREQENIIVEDSDIDIPGNPQLQNIVSANLTHPTSNPEQRNASVETFSSSSGYKKEDEAEAGSEEVEVAKISRKSPRKQVKTWTKNQKKEAKRQMRGSKCSCSLDLKVLGAAIFMGLLIISLVATMLALMGWYRSMRQAHKLQQNRAIGQEEIQTTSL